MITIILLILLVWILCSLAIWSSMLLLKEAFNVPMGKQYYLLIAGGPVSFVAIAIEHIVSDSKN